MAAMYEGHLEHGRFRDLFDECSTEWAAIPKPQKLNDLKAIETAGVPVAEVIAHYRETHAGRPNGGVDAVERLSATMLAYRRAGYAPALPPDVEAAVRRSGSRRNVSSDGPPSRWAGNSGLDVSCKAASVGRKRKPREKCLRRRRPRWAGAGTSPPGSA
ncbi:MAG: hypothetical protein JWO31_2698 [Phycisphaerales bacterium]|nr:hypothetical protein [Phycisphaerales bacterium]